MSEPTIHRWPDPPVMDVGAPEPALHEEGDTAWVAHRGFNPDFPGWEAGAALDHPGFDEYCAVLKFSGVRSIVLGPPSDERLHEHPLYEVGLKQYDFSAVVDSPAAADHVEAFHWIVTFHDDTLDVVAERAEVVAPRVDADRPIEALRHVR